MFRTAGRLRSRKRRPGEPAASVSAGDLSLKSLTVFPFSRVKRKSSDCLPFPNSVTSWAFLSQYHDPRLPVLCFAGVERYGIVQQIRLLAAHRDLFRTTFSIIRQSEFVVFGKAFVNGSAARTARASATDGKPSSLASSNRLKIPNS